MLITRDPLEEQLVPYYLHKRLIEATELHEGRIGEAALVSQEHHRQMQRPIHTYPTPIAISRLWSKRGIRWDG
jgi:hypothetical protein